MREDLRRGILTTASALGISPLDLATAISYETAGTFDPTKKGPTTKWGTHRGLIQFGEPQAQKYGVDWNNPLGSQLGPDGAVAKYLRDTGVQPGMGLLDVYSAINAGGVGRYNASDEAAGGAPGSVRDKVEKQMAGHRAKAEALLGAIGPDASSPAGGARAASEVQPMTPQPSSPLSAGGGLLASSPFSIPTEVAQYATADDTSPAQKIGGLLAAIGKAIPDAQHARMGPIGDARQTGGLLNEFLSAPPLHKMIQQRRFR